MGCSVTKILGFQSTTNNGDPPNPRTIIYLVGQGGYFQKLSYGSETLDMTSEGLGEMFEGDSADTCTGKFPLTSLGSERRVSRAQTRERGPPSALAEFFSFLLIQNPRKGCRRVSNFCMGP